MNNDRSPWEDGVAPSDWQYVSDQYADHFEHADAEQDLELDVFVCAAPRRRLPPGCNPVGAPAPATLTDSPSSVSRRGAHEHAPTSP